MKHFHKKVHADDLEPDTLITSKYSTDFYLIRNWLETIVYFSVWKENDQELEYWDRRMNELIN